MNKTQKKQLIVVFILCAIGISFVMGIFAHQKIVENREIQLKCDYLDHTG